MRQAIVAEVGLNKVVKDLCCSADKERWADANDQAEVRTSKKWKEDKVSLKAGCGKREW